MQSFPRSLRSAFVVVALGLVVVSLPACGSDETAEDTSTTRVQTTSTTEPERSPEDQEVVDVATALCQAYGGLDQPGAVDNLVSNMADDIVVTDTVIGADLTGTDAVRGYVTSDAFAGIDSMECGAFVQRGNWAAGSYTLSDSTTGGGGQGIAAIHVADGKVDRQINYYTQAPTGAVPPPADTVADSVVVDYCHAWDDGADADEVLSLMSADPQLELVTSLAGADAIRTFIDTSFDFDQNDCGDAVVVHGDWGAGANGFTNTVNGTAVEGVNVVLIDANGLIAKHFVHMDSAA